MKLMTLFEEVLSGEDATAISAIAAIDQADSRPTVATIATIAVASTPKPETGIPPEVDARITRLAQIGDFSNKDVAYARAWYSREPKEVLFILDCCEKRTGLV